jgi:uncharacterized membrane protein
MTMLYAAAAVFLAIHLLISGTRIRDAIAGAIGERAYLGLFSLASIGAIVWLCIAYNAAQAGSDDSYLYNFGHAVHDLGIPVIFIAFWLGVQGLLMPNPTSVGQDNAAIREDTVKGVLRITRHPFLWGVVIWSGFHLLANGDTASIVLFGTFFVTALLGTVSIDAKRRRKMGAAWEGFAARTSNIPFGAWASGRSALKLGESFGWRFWLATLIFLVVLFAHAWVFGVSPFPNGWRPF